MHSTLYIIGNGFDRYHGLDTRYHSFAFYMKENYSELYDMLTQYYYLTDLDPDDPDSYKDPLWADFENKLAELDYDTVLEDNKDYLASPSSPDFRDRDWHAYQIQMEGIVDNLTKELCAAFKEFILAVEFPESVDEKILSLERNSVFLNFNYTNTLERYYFTKSQRILYIHGKANIPDDKLILGHGIDPLAFQGKQIEPPQGLSEEELEMWKDQMANDYDYSFESGKSELMSYFQDSFKGTDEIINKHNSFFESLKGIKKIFVLGHSISLVDQPYFKKIIASIEDKEVPWTVSFYSDKSHIDRLISLGVQEGQVRPIKMETLRLTDPTLFD